MTFRPTAIQVSDSWQIMLLRNPPAGMDVGALQEAPLLVVLRDVAPELDRPIAVHDDPTKHEMLDKESSGG